MRIDARRRLLPLATVVLVFGLLAPAATGAGADPLGPIVLFGDKSYAPLSYLDNGQVKGIDVDIAKAIGRTLHREVRIELLEWHLAQLRVLRGDGDGLLSMSVTDERKALYDFTEPTIVHEFAVFARQGSPMMFAAADLSGTTIGVTPGGFPRRFFERRPSVRMRFIANYEEGFGLLDRGVLDAMPADRWVAAYTIERQHLTNVSMAGEPFAVVPGAIAVLKGRSQLVADISRAVKSLKADGTIARIQAAWQPQEMVYISREKIRHQHRMANLYVVGAVFAGMAGWIVTLMRQRRVRKIAEERFATAFRASPDCIAISDMNGVIEINQRFEEITGYTREEIIGRSIVDLGLVTAEVRDQLLARLRHNGAVRDLEYAIRRKDGSVGTILWSAELLELDGRQCFLSVNRDITAQKRAEEALHRSEAKYRELVQNANDVIFTVDREGYCLALNPMGALVTGLTAQEPRGVHLSQIVAPEHAPLALAQLGLAMHGETVAPFELDIIPANGRRMTFELGVRPVYENGVIVAIQGIARDVTSRRELEAQLRQAQKMDAIGRLAAGVAHDFNNLLTVILGSCEAGSGQLPAGDPVASRLDDIRSAAERAASLTGQLLAFSRRQITKSAVLNLNDVIADVQRMLSRLIGEDIQSCFIPGADLGLIRADTGQLQQVLMNLAVNARDAMPRGGRFTIETSSVHLDTEYTQRHSQVPPGDYIVLAVSDTGVGMDAATQARLFEPFFTTKDVGQGTGLGLATVYGIVKQSGAYIWVYSEPGMGSTFKIYFPRVHATVSAPELVPAVVGSVAGDESILIAEDEDDLRELLREYLAGHGYRVESAPGGAEALGLCVHEGFRPTLLVTDVVMPGIGGRALADRLRKRDPNLKVIFLSGYTDEAMLRHGILPSGTQFMQKPFALQALARTVRHVLDEPRAESHVA